MAKIFLGYDLDNQKVYITKHSWDCDWYWGLGYLGNGNSHYHMDSSWLNKHEAWKIDNHLIEKDRLISQKDWWLLGDMFKSAYALKEVAEVYHRGGSNWTETKDLGVSKDLEKWKEINKDLKKVLDDIWAYLENLEKNKG